MASIEPIAHIHCDLKTKFGVPRQAGLVDTLPATIVFETPFQHPDAVRGLDSFSHIWLIWGFSHAKEGAFSPTVRPPRLGGNARMGVFATRSPNRPNKLGLSCVKLQKIEQHPCLGTLLHVLGADLVDGTPIYDIKPYIVYADSYPQAQSGYASSSPSKVLDVHIPKELLMCLPSHMHQCLYELLQLDPRPAYQDTPERIYGMAFGNYDIQFKVDGHCLLVVGIKEV